VSVVDPNDDAAIGEIADQVEIPVPIDINGAQPNQAQAGRDRAFAAVLSELEVDVGVPDDGRKVRLPVAIEVRTDPLNEGGNRKKI
jgi:hypothetical protein